MKRVPLTRGYYACVDDADYPLVRQYSWYADVRSYTCYATTTIDGRPVRMHNLIMGAKRVDHRDHDGLNNTRSNLRLATQKQNSFNTRKRGKFFKGVTHQPRLKKRPWQARIQVDAIQIHLGYFKTALEAASVYNVAARKYFGDFAYVNEVTEVEPSKSHRYLIVSKRLIPAPDRGQLVEYKLACGHIFQQRAYRRFHLGVSSHCTKCQSGSVK